MSGCGDRRAFLGQAAAGGAVLLLGQGTGCTEPRGDRGAKAGRAGKAAQGRARVVLVACPAAVGEDNAVVPARVRAMLERGLCALTGDADARKAVSRFVRTTDTVGLKVNGLAGRHMSTRVPLTEALVDLLEAAGLERRRAVVFDRSDRDLRLAGYELRTSGKNYRCLGNDRAGYDQELTIMKSGASRVATIATRHASVLVNLPVLKDHGIAGLSGALKNNFGLVHNPNKFHLHGCDPHVAEVNAVDAVRRKQKLVVCDALRVQVEGGPAYHPAGAATRGALLLATDPVALDVVALELLEAMRKEKKLPSLARDKRPAVHIATAAAHGLGVGDRKRIDVVKVDVG